MKRPLSKEQLLYAQSRLNAIRTAERDAIAVACKLPDPKNPTFGEFIKGIKSGRIKLKDWKKPEDQIVRHTEIDAVFTIEVRSGYNKYDEEKHSAMLKAHDLKWQGVMDKLMLGDAQEVLAIIAQAEKFTVS